MLRTRTASSGQIASCVIFEFRELLRTSLLKHDSPHYNNHCLGLGLLNCFISLNPLKVLQMSSGMMDTVPGGESDQYDFPE